MAGRRHAGVRMTGGKSGTGPPYGRLLGGVAAIACCGFIGGWLLARVAIGDGLYGPIVNNNRASFAELSGNPEATAPDSPAVPMPCPGCANADAAAAQLRAASYDRMGDEYLAIEPVEITYPPIRDSAAGMGQDAPELAAPQTSRRETPVPIEIVGEGSVPRLPEGSVPALPSPPPVVVDIPAAGSAAR